MSPTNFSIILLLFGAFFWFIHLCAAIFSLTHKTFQKRPPGPLGLPFIGHLHMLGKLPHRTLNKLSQVYGPIMFLRLGSVPTIIVSSPAAAELFLKTHDTIFASRPRSQASDYLWYGTKAMAFTENGAHWRSVRKFCTLELLSSTKINSMEGLRREALLVLVESLKKAAVTHEVVDVSEKVAHLTEDMTFRMLLGKSRDDKLGLSQVIQDLAEIVGAFNIADYVPFLGALDLQGFTRRLRVISKAADKILETIIDDHEQDANKSYVKLDRDFVDVILSLKNNSTGTHGHLAQNIDRSSIKAIILDMIFGAIDTSQTAIEWIMSELIRHPRVISLVQQEIRNVIEDCEFVEESHLSKLDYLDMVVKESMRLHPVGPLLIPRESLEDIVIDGYYIKKKSHIIVNTWGIGRDPRIWSDNVERFLPERFIGSNIDLRGKSFQLMPFGSGRRGCPAMYLGQINIKLVVAQLVHSFNWELPYGMSPEELDMDEAFGLTMPRAKHLLAIPSLAHK
ncbi:Ferulate-5-hydroxylase [Heracleum sosnowskyi]|uniref:Ferulate-5-hydroxylase n=1 Tax=Heracleum sosnowskyi TaxID=360622 RepID=A0AAD8IM21_9APIA|nr:Ferulate-5-hydroxylase [Heracleum sosnowskyi]